MRSPLTSFMWRTSAAAPLLFTRSLLNLIFKSNHFTYMLTAVDGPLSSGIRSSTSTHSQEWQAQLHSMLLHRHNAVAGNVSLVVRTVPPSSTPLSGLTLLQNGKYKSTAPSKSIVNILGLFPEDQTHHCETWIHLTRVSTPLAAETVGMIIPHNVASNEGDAITEVAIHLLSFKATTQ